MTANLEPDHSYKPSGVRWLGDVPAHWEVLRLKNVLAERSEKGFPGQPLLAATQSKGVVRKEQFDNRTVVPMKDLHLLKLVRVGDFVISLRSFQGGIEYAHDQGIVSPAYTVLSAINPSNQGFLTYLFKSQPFIANLGLFVTGIRQGQNIDYEKLSRAAVPLPPLPEQAAIVRYLDYVDRRIRRYIEAKDKLIGLLAEEKQGIINQAVTRGLDPNVPLKPSGVEWLGGVPAHWEVPRLRNLGDALIGLTYDPQDVVDEDAGMLVLRASNILDGKLVYGDNVYVRSTISDKLVTREGDILICSRSGSRALIGKNARINAESAGTTFGAFMTVFRGPNNDYLHLVFNSKFFEYQSAAFFTSTINQLTLGILYDMKVPLPPREERHPVLRYVKETTVPIIKAIAAARRQIELIQEYRTRLVADVVTGKLDVREAAAELPEGAGGAASIDEEAMRPDSMDGDPFEESQPTEEEIEIEREVTV